MEKFLESSNKIPRVVKVLLSFIIFDVFWAIWRIIKGFNNKSFMQVIIGFLWIVLGPFILWVLDFISTIVNDYPFWIK